MSIGFKYWKAEAHSAHCVHCPPGLSLEDLALVECFTHMFEISLPGKVLLYHGLALLADWI